MSRPSEERRLNRRMRLEDSDGALEISLDGSVLDISVSGMAIETQGRLSPRRPIILRLHHPDEVVKIEGQVVWCFLQGTRNDGDGENRRSGETEIKHISLSPLLPFSEFVLQPSAFILSTFPISFNLGEQFVHTLAFLFDSVSYKMNFRGAR